MYQERFGLRRRDFIKGCAAATAGTVAPIGSLIGAANALAADKPSAPQQGSNAVRSVRPEIGTGWRGHMYSPASRCAPSAWCRLSPDTAGGPEPQWNARGDYTGWEHCSGYYYPDNVVIGFSHTHLQGTGGSDLGDVLLMPVVDGRNWAWEEGIPQNTALLQIEEYSGRTLAGSSTNRSRGIARSFLTIARHLGPDITACISTRPM